MAQGQVHSVAGGDEHGAHALVDGGAVHVDGGAQGQDEAGDVPPGAQPLRALQVQRQGAHGGGRGERHGHGREHPLEEGQRTHAAQGLYRGRVDDDGVEEVPDIGAQQHQAQIAQDLGTIFRHHRQDQAEHADGGEAQDDVHDLHADLCKAVDQRRCGPSLLSGGQDAEAEQQRRHDHLQHGGVGKGGDDVGGEDVHQRVHEAGGLTGLKGDTGGVDDREEALEQVGQEHGQHDGPGSGAGIIHQRFDADGTHLADIAHGDDAGENGEKDDGHHHELQQVQENGAEGLDIADGKGGISREGHADRDA